MLARDTHPSHSTCQKEILEDLALFLSKHTHLALVRKGCRLHEYLRLMGSTLIGTAHWNPVQ